MRLKNIMLAAGVGTAVVATASPASAADGDTFLVSRSGQHIVDVNACRYHYNAETQTYEWQADFGNGFVDIHNVICDGENIYEHSAPPGGGNGGVRNEQVQSATAQNVGRVQFERQPVVQSLPIERGIPAPTRSSKKK